MRRIYVVYLDQAYAANWDVLAAFTNRKLAKEYALSNSEYKIKEIEVDPSPKMRLLRDIEFNGVKHKAGTIYSIKYPDEIEGDTIQWCFGHGSYWPLKIGEDVEIVGWLQD